MLDVSMHDARVIQGALDQAANTGVYLLGGDVCSDATGRALNRHHRRCRAGAPDLPPITTGAGALT